MIGNKNMKDKKEIFIVEELEDLSINPKICPLSADIREICIKHLRTNPILDNGQMVCLNCTEDIQIKIFDFFQKILIEFIESEKK